MYIYDTYQSSLKFYCQRFSNNANPIFTNEELLTIYLFCGAYQRYFNIKEIYTFTKEYLLSWFPNLPSYHTFYRLNLMSGEICELVKHFITFFKPADCNSMISLIDFIPIITCAGKNKTENVAIEIASKGYCSTENMYYFGLKLHALAFRTEGTIPFPETIILSAAEENDLTVLKREAADSIINKEIFADKIYSGSSFWENKQQGQGVTMITPVKAIKGEHPVITQRERAETYSRLLYKRSDNP